MEETQHTASYLYKGWLIRKIWRGAWIVRSPTNRRLGTFPDFVAARIAVDEEIEQEIGKEKPTC